MRSLRSPFVSIVFVTAACSGMDPQGLDKEDAQEAPFAVDEADGKADSVRGPVDKGMLKVGRAAEGKFTATEGWIAHEVTLTKGSVDFFATGVEADGKTPQDTVLYVFGPKKRNGTFPQRALGFNDDEAAGTLSSHVAADIPEDGEYRVVVSTYANWQKHPRNVARGTWSVTVRCPRSAGPLSCGPAALAEGGACWADLDCVEGLRCSGEVVCAPNTNCFFTRQGQCAVDTVWMSLAPKQCGSNPWQQSPTAGTSPLQGELADVQNYFAAQGIALRQLGLLAPSEPTFHCLSCSCARGDLLLVEARRADAARLEREYGLKPAATDAFDAFSPVQCGGNAWEEDADKELERANVVEWARTNGATPLSAVGFVFRGELTAHCLACSCARGDLLVAASASSEARDALLRLGFADLYLP